MDAGRGGMNCPSGHPSETYGLEALIHVYGALGKPLTKGLQQKAINAGLMRKE